MKLTTKTVYILRTDKGVVESDTEHKAIYNQQMLKNVIGLDLKIEQVNKVIYEIEVGDKVYLLKNGKPDMNRVDIVTKIVENMWGDTVYLTEEVGGEYRRGEACRQNICLFEELQEGVITC